ncbi:MAG: flavin reductase [Bacteroidales bacterium]|nr:flavin reductase [Bacteroidales bacterium]
MGAKLYVTPQPALMIATYDAEGNPDVMMAAWGGQYEGNQVCFQLSSHKTTENIRLNKAFTLSYADARTVAESDYFGIASGRDVKDKVAHVGFHCTNSQNVNAPIIDEYPLAMECKVVELIERENNGAFVVGEIVNAVADPAILTDGKIDIKKLNPLVWDASSLNYFTIADSVGKAWNSGMKLK